jgi:hypothetical protein
MLVTLLLIVMLVRLVDPQKASTPMLVTDLPSIAVGMISAPDAFISQPVVVTASPLISYFKLGSTGAAFQAYPLLLLPFVFSFNNRRLAAPTHDNEQWKQ